MINKRLSNLKVMGFATFAKKDSVSLDEILEKSLVWQKSFLAKQEGISFHCLLTNLKGDLADVIFATDEEAFVQMLQNFEQDNSSKDFISLIDSNTTKLFKNTILQDNFSVPHDFSCLEFGTFKIKSSSVDEAEVLSVADKIRVTYLSGFKENLAHFIGKLDNETFSEVSFGTTIAHGKDICNGYMKNKTCMELINFFDPESVNLDFWCPIA